MRERVEVRREEGRLVVRRRPPGPVAQGCVGVATGLLWGVLAMLILPTATGCLPSILLGICAVFLLAFLHYAKAAWRFEATSDRVDFIREGLLGERRRSWPAWDVASFWVVESGGEGGNTWHLWIGFGNGRKEELLQGDSSELARVAELLKTDRPKPRIPRPAEPEAPKPPPSEVVPKGVRLVRLDPGFKIELEGQLVEVGPDALEISGAGRWRKADVDHVQTYSDAGAWELQVLLKDRSKARVLSGHPAGELEWLARFLRLAIRGKEEVEKLRVDAKEGTCQVCGEGMSTAGVVTCARCRTPHHAECWTYVGQCSTYGCREIRALS